MEQEVQSTERDLAQVAQALYALPLDAPEDRRRRVLDRVAALEDRVDELRQRLGLPTSYVLKLVDLVRQRRLGSGKAAELAETPLAIFLRLMGTEGVPVFDYDENDLADEFTPSSADQHS